MTDAPKRIWAWASGVQPLSFYSGLWRSENVEGATEYVRADVAAAMVAAACKDLFNKMIDFVPPEQRFQAQKFASETALGTEALDRALEKAREEGRREGQIRAAQGALECKADGCGMTAPCMYDQCQHPLSGRARGNT